MAALALRSPSLSSPSSSVSSAAASLRGGGRGVLFRRDFRSRFCSPNFAKCSLDEQYKLVNGKPLVPVTDAQTLTKLLDSKRLDNSVNRSNNTRLKLFSGTANPALSETQGRESIGAKLVANQITKAGANRVLACDLHSGQSMGYFDIPIDHVYCQHVVLDYLASKNFCSSDLVVVSPDVGGVARARAFAKKLSDAPLAIVDKRRQGHNIAEVMNLIGDVKGKVAIMVDDMIDTAGTIAKGAALLREEGAKAVYACCTHGVFSPPAIERLSSGIFEEVIITNTIPVAPENYFPQLTVLSTANLLGETIWRIHDDSSVSSIFQ